MTTHSMKPAIREDVFKGDQIGEIHTLDDPGSHFSRTSELTRVLRWGGGCVLVAAAVAFMFQGVYSFDPMVRHWIMLAICGLLGFLGMVTGTIISEEKGARTFLGFAAALFPVLASQLGAMFFSLFGRPPLGMPTPLVFSLASSSRVMAVTGMTLAIVVPASYLAFRILARSQAGLLTLSFTIVNLCILLPIREGTAIGLVIAAVACGIYCVDTLILRRDFRLGNFEGRVARLLLVTPLAVLLGRTLFYAVDHIFYCILLTLTGSYLSFHWARVVKSVAAENFCRLTGMVCLALGWLVFLLPHLNWTTMGRGIITLLILLPLAVIPALQSLVINDSEASNYRNASAFIILLAIGLGHWFEATSMVSLIGTAVTILTIGAGTLMGEKPVFFCGLSAFIISLGNFGLMAVRLHSSYAWVALALLGIAVMFSASLIEKGRIHSLTKGTSLWGRYRP